MLGIAAHAPVQHANAPACLFVGFVFFFQRDVGGFVSGKKEAEEERVAKFEAKQKATALQHLQATAASPVINTSALLEVK